MTAHIELRGIRKAFGEEFSLAVDLSIDQGESVVLLGPSGCGKTTTLRMIAGFDRPDGGSIHLGGQPVADDQRFVPPEKRRIGVVFQNYALWPHMTVAKNLAYALRHGTPRRSRDKAGDRSRVAAALERVQLGDLGNRYPHQLSGGQQQRVALARALIYEPEALLLDEPLSSLDANLRDDMRLEIKRLHREHGITMIYVTHDQTEALSLADRIVVMRHGMIEQSGSPTELFEDPSSLYVARALGPTNVLRGHITESKGATRVVRLDASGRTVALPASGDVGSDVTIIARPTHLLLERDSGAGDLSGVVDEVVFLGEHAQYVIELDDGERVHCLTHANRRFERAERIEISLDVDRVTTLQDDSPLDAASNACADGEKPQAEPA